MEYLIIGIVSLVAGFGGGVYVGWRFVAGFIEKLDSRIDLIADRAAEKIKGIIK
jgi:hypothetical protein